MGAPGSTLTHKKIYDKEEDRNRPAQQKFMTRSDTKDLGHFPRRAWMIGLIRERRGPVQQGRGGKSNQRETNQPKSRGKKGTKKKRRRVVRDGGATNINVVSQWQSVKGVGKERRLKVQNAERGRHEQEKHTLLLRRRGK